MSLQRRTTSTHWAAISENPWVAVCCMHVAGVDVTVASVEDSLEITASRSIKLVADTLIQACEGPYDCIALPVRSLFCCLSYVFLSSAQGAGSQCVVILYSLDTRTCPPYPSCPVLPGVLTRWLVLLLAAFAQQFQYHHFSVSTSASATRVSLMQPVYSLRREVCLVLRG